MNEPCCGFSGRPSTSGLTEYQVSMVTNTEKALEEPEDKPTLVEIIIAIILLVLAVAGLVAYAYIFWKKRQKRIRRRNQFGVGHKPPSPYPRPRPRGASVTPTGISGSANGMPLASSRPSFPGVRMNHSSSSESSYKGLGSDSDEDDVDVFAKELRLAASLDRRTWNEFQHRGQSPLNNDTTLGRSHVSAESPSSSTYNAETNVYRDLTALCDREGETGARHVDYGIPGELSSARVAVGLMVTGDTVSIQSSSSFPYGDEHEKDEYLPNRQIPYGSSLSDPTKRTTEAFEDEHLESDDTSGGWRVIKSALSQSKNNHDSCAKPSRYSFLFPGHQSMLEPETHSSGSTSALEEGKCGSSDRTSAALRGSPMSNSWSTNPPRGAGSVENATTAAIRGSPQSSSWLTGSSSRGMSQLSQGGSLAASPAIETTAAVHEESSLAAVSEETSMMTADIIKEVQRLTQFVKTYEKKKDLRLKRGHDGVDDVTLSNSMTSGMDYDSLMETVNSLQNVVGRDQSKENTNQQSHTHLTTRVKTLSTTSLTPLKQSSSSSPDGGFGGTNSKDDEMSGVRSVHSDSSSDVETMESDDLSRRLGITPFQVQNPNTLERSPVASATYSPGQMYQRTKSSEDEAIDDKSQKRKIATNDVSHKRPSKVLSNLRQNDAILDHGSDVVAASSEDLMASSTKPEPASAFPLRHPQSIMPRQRSKNEGFNNIVLKFESRSRDPIYPSNESWQYN